MPYHSAQLDQVVYLQTMGGQRNSAGDWIDAVAQSVKTRAKVEDSRGGEMFVGAQVQANLVVKFIIRFQKGVEPGQTVLWKDHQFDIEHIAHEGRDQWLILTAVARHVKELDPDA